MPHCRKCNELSSFFGQVLRVDFENLLPLNTVSELEEFARPWSTDRSFFLSPNNNFIDQFHFYKKASTKYNHRTGLFSRRKIKKNKYFSPKSTANFCIPSAREDFYSWNEKVLFSKLISHSTAHTYQYSITGLYFTFTFFYFFPLICIKIAPS